MNSKTGKSIIVLFTALVITGTLFAQPRTGRGLGPCMNPGINNAAQPGSGLACILTDLTEDQQNELNKLRTAHFQEMRDFRNQMAELTAKQRTIMSKYDVDTDAAKKVAALKTELMKKRMEASIDHQADVKKVLTEEQYLQLEQIRARNQFRKGNNRGPGGAGFYNNRQNCPGNGYQRGGYGPGRNNFRGGAGPAALNEEVNLSDYEKEYQLAAWMKEPFVQ